MMSENKYVCPDCGASMYIMEPPNESILHCSECLRGVELRNYQSPVQSAIKGDN